MVILSCHWPRVECTIMRNIPLIFAALFISPPYDGSFRGFGGYLFAFGKHGLFFQIWPFWVHCVVSWSHLGITDQLQSIIETIHTHTLLVKHVILRNQFNNTLIIMIILIKQIRIFIFFRYGDINKLRVARPR